MRHQWKRASWRGEQTCTRCHLSQPLIQLTNDVYATTRHRSYKSDSSEKLGTTKPLWDPYYVREHYVNRVIQTLSGSTLHEINSDSFIQTLLTDLPNPCTWQQIHKTLRSRDQMGKLYKNRWIEIVPFLHKSPDLSPDLLRIFRQVATTPLPTTNGNVLLPPLYVLRKLVELNQGSQVAHWIPCKFSLKTLQRYDQFWLRICHDKHWIYQGTKPEPIEWKSILQALTTPSTTIPPWEQISAGLLPYVPDWL